MLLLKADIRKIWKDSGRLLVIFMLSGFGTIAGAFLAYYLLAAQIKDLHIAAAMMVGTYTGGSVNLVAMADAFKADGVLVSTSVVADNLLMALYFFVLIAIPSSKFFYNHLRHPIMDEGEAKIPGRKRRRGKLFETRQTRFLAGYCFCFLRWAFVIVAVSTDFLRN
jgi:uncharacterized membrane protein